MSTFYRALKAHSRLEGLPHVARKKIQLIASNVTYLSHHYLIMI